MTGFLLTGCSNETSSDFTSSKAQYYYNIEKPNATRFFYNKETKEISILTTIEKEREVYVPKSTTAIFAYDDQNETYSTIFITKNDYLTSPDFN